MIFILCHPNITKQADHFLSPPGYQACSPPTTPQFSRSALPPFWRNCFLSCTPPPWPPTRETIFKASLESSHFPQGVCDPNFLISAADQWQRWGLQREGINVWHWPPAHKAPGSLSILSSINFVSWLHTTAVSWCDCHVHFITRPTDLRERSSVAQLARDRNRILPWSFRIQIWLELHYKRSVYLLSGRRIISWETDAPSQFVDHYEGVEQPYSLPMQ